MESRPIMFGIFPPDVVALFEMVFAHPFDVFAMTPVEAEWLGKNLDEAMRPRDATCRDCGCPARRCNSYGCGRKCCPDCDHRRKERR